MHTVKLSEGRAHPMTQEPIFKHSLKVTMATWLLTTACNENALLPLSRFMCFCLFCLSTQPICAPWAPSILVEGSSIYHYINSGQHVNVLRSLTLKVTSKLAVKFPGMSWSSNVDCIHVWLPTSSHVNVNPMAELRTTSSWWSCSCSDCGLALRLLWLSSTMKKLHLQAQGWANVC